MDVVLHGADNLILDTVWQSLNPSWDRENIWRQMFSLYALTLVGIFILYFGIAGASYAFLFDKRMMRHPRFIKNQVKLEIKMSITGFPILDLMTLPWFLGECRGYSLMYEGIENSPLGEGYWRGLVYIVASAALFLWFTDLMIYFVHRWLHWPSVYKHLHKPHHKWVIPTPFASHAFNPVDGYLQSIPYHAFVYAVPLHKYTYLILFVIVNLWSIFIHDSDMIVGHPLERIINGPAHHTLHHMYFICNYGQYFTWADRTWGSYRHPQTKDDPLHAVLAQEEKKKQYAEEKQAMAKLDEEIRANKLSAMTSSSSSTLLRRQTSSGAESSSSTSSSEDGVLAVVTDSGFEGSDLSDKDEVTSAQKPQSRRRK